MKVISWMKNFTAAKCRTCFAISVVLPLLTFLAGYARPQTEALSFVGGGVLTSIVLAAC